jgi:hypothetical protein
MKLRKLSAVLVAALLALISTSLASAQTAYATSFTTSITFQNVGTATANSSLTYFAENSSTPINTTLAALPAGAGSSVFVGSVSQVNAGFKGSAVLSSDQPLVATLVQIAVGSPVVKNRPLSNGFSSGASTVRLATVLKNQFSTTTVFSVQNAGSAAVNFTVNLIPTSGATIPITVNGLPAGAAKYFDMGTLSQVAAASFNGSATITSSTPGASLVATAMELSTNGIAARAFEGVTGGANTVYMPSALCNFVISGNPSLVNTAYAIQNVGSTATAAKVTFAYPSGNKVFTTASIPPGGKASVPGCAGGGANNSSGSATITTQPAGGSLVAIGKVDGAGISSAFLGATAGSAKLALPYVRWSQTAYSTGAKQRAFIAIQNVGGPLAANAIKIKYVDKNGATVGTHTINTAVATGAKVNSNPFILGAPAAEFGSYPDGSFGGGAIVEGPAGSQLVAVVRVQSFVPATGATVGEDYNGIPIQ